MPPERIPQSHPNPEAAQQFADVRADCSAAIAALLQENSDEMELIVGDAATVAATSGDMLAFETQFDNLLAVPRLSLPTLAQVCLAGVSAGSERAYETLESIVRGEKESVRRTMETNPQVFDVDPLYGYSGDAGLANIFSTCVKTDTPPNAWIEKAALNPMHRWTLYYEYCVQTLREDLPEQHAALQSTIDGLAEALLHTEQFQPPFSRAATRQILPLIKNPDLRERLFGSLLQDIEDRPCDDPLKDLQHFAAALTDYADGLGRQKDMRYDATLLKAHDAFELIVEHLEGLGYSTKHVVSGYVAVSAAFTRYAARKTEDVVEAINSYVIELSEGSPEDADLIYNVRDQVLYRHAVLTAKSGDFVAARSLIAAMHADIRKRDALYDCYKYVREVSDLECLRFDGLLLDPAEAPEADRIAAEANLSCDPAKISEAMLAIAEKADDNLTYFEYIERLGSKLSGLDEQLAANTTRQVLASVREHGSGLYCFYTLCLSLIRKGDADELTRTYQEITHEATRIGNRIYRLHRLRQTIDKAFPTLPEPSAEVKQQHNATFGGDDPVMRAIIELLETMEE